MFPDRIFSGMRPTGSLHLGHYHGVLKNWVRLQSEYPCFFCVVDWHALTTHYETPEVIEKNVWDVLIDWLASGIDPAQATLFIQSKVPEHAELALLLGMSTPLGWLERVPTYKEQQEKLKDKDLSTYGFLGYPVLMAADILLYQTDLVPVGEDQKQHLELTRDLAIRFNRDYGQTFVVPDPFIPKVGARIMSLADPTKKMSKSDEESEAGCIMLLDDDDAVRRKFKRAVTDSGSEIKFDESHPAINNLLTIYHLLTNKTPAEIEEQFKGKGYAALKQELADVCIEFLRPIQESVRSIDDDKLGQILEQGAERAEAIAQLTLNHARKSLGLIGARS
jgi:tryptophanyl-tRNA synthetase